MSISFNCENTTVKDLIKMTLDNTTSKSLFKKDSKYRKYNTNIKGCNNIKRFIIGKDKIIIITNSKFNVYGKNYKYNGNPNIDYTDINLVSVESTCKDVTTKILIENDEIILKYTNVKHECYKLKFSFDI